jgi:hypothetical protein
MNPWLRVPAADYEGHMGPEGADQLRVLADLFQETCTFVRPRRVAVIGCATGNGFDRVDPLVTQRLVGVDLNPEYLAIARDRHARLGTALELVCGDVARCDLGAGSLDIVFAGLVLEYVEPAEVLHRMAGWLAPGGILGVVIQLPCDSCPEITPTRYASVQGLGEVMRLVEPAEVLARAGEAGLVHAGGREVPVAHGKRFRFKVFRREEECTTPVPSRGVP